MIICDVQNEYRYLVSAIHVLERINSTATSRCSSQLSKGRDIMMTSSNGNIFRVTGPLCGEFIGQRWIPRTKASDAELWCFLWSAPWIDGWINNREAGDLRRHRTHHDLIVMISISRRPCCGKSLKGLYSLNSKTSYRQISWRLETARLDVLLPRCL